MRRLLLVIITTICYTTSTAVNLAAAPAGVTSQVTSTLYADKPQQETIELASIQSISKSHGQKTPTRGAFLSLPSIRLSTQVVTVGVTDANEIAVPATQAGRWIGSAGFGNHGTTFLDGHVYGVFSNLSQVRSGQPIIATQDGQTYTYTITDIQTIDLNDVNIGQLLHAYDTAEGLVIMTCAGDYLPSLDTYSKRLVVYADRAN